MFSGIGGFREGLSRTGGFAYAGHCEIDKYAVFENIHPFADGNGRIGRTLLNYYLMIHNHPPLIVYDEDKTLYYECLEKYDAEETIAPLTEFLRYETEKTWEKTLERGEKKDRKKRLDELR